MSVWHQLSGQQCAICGHRRLTHIHGRCFIYFNGSKYDTTYEAGPCGCDGKNPDSARCLPLFLYEDTPLPVVIRYQQRLLRNPVASEYWERDVREVAELRAHLENAEGRVS